MSMCGLAFEVPPWGLNVKKGWVLLEYAYNLGDLNCCSVKDSINLYDKKGSAI